MRRSLQAAALLVVVTLAYLFLWPVPIEPVAWQAPPNRGYVDPFASNDQLQYTRTITLGDYEGPEDVAIGADGSIYATTSSGAVVRVRNPQVNEVAVLDGRGLGIESDDAGALVIANAHTGLQRVMLDGSVSNLLTEIDGEPLLGANNLAIGTSGSIYFSVSSRKFAASDYNGTYAASIVDILEHGGHGSVYSFNPNNGRVTTLMTNLNYANGVAVDIDEQFLIVAETGHYRIHKYWLQGPLAGRSEILIDNLPAFPDNVKQGLNGRFWIGMVAPRNPLLDRLSDSPWLRKVVWRLPGRLRPKAEEVSHVIAINGEGDVLMNLHDEQTRFPALTGVLETPDALILSTLFGHQLPILSKVDL